MHAGHHMIGGTNVSVATGWMFTPDLDKSGENVLCCISPDLNVHRCAERFVMQSPNEVTSQCVIRSVPFCDRHSVLRKKSCQG